MLIYSRYIISSLLSVWITTIIGLLAIAWMVKSVRVIKLILESGIEFSYFASMLVSIIPAVLHLVIPIATAISIILFIHKITATRELVSLKSAGLSNILIVKPMLIFAGGVIIFGLYNAIYLMPTAYKRFNYNYHILKNEYSALLLQPGVFNTKISGITVYVDGVRSKDGKTTFDNIFVHDTRKVPITMIAKKAELDNSEGEAKLILYNGTQQQKVDGKINMLFFSSYMFDISSFYSTDERKKMDPNELYISEMLRMKGESKNVREIKAYAHHRLTWPFMSFVFVVTISALMMPSFYNIKYVKYRVILSSVATILLTIVSLALKIIVIEKPYLAMLFYIYPACVLAISFIYLNRSAAWHIFVSSKYK